MGPGMGTLQLKNLRIRGTVRWAEFSAAPAKYRARYTSYTQYVVRPPPGPCQRPSFLILAWDKYARPSITWTVHSPKEPRSACAFLEAHRRIYAGAIGINATSRHSELSRGKSRAQDCVQHCAPGARSQCL